ncbi:hypothetical protein Z043_110297 [Scleropages formosus]|uniref:Zinc-ribbon domain-containing protein n=1 Tax=Scleropages formosus TaxID=113540 RepID=A0A0P7V7H0_SCLFO|nr:hypothetical protein Z043_110297 [Scleropages formosus]
MGNLYITNVAGALLKAAAQSRACMTMSCTKSTIIISSVLGSVANCPKTFSTAQMYPYHASKVFPRAQCIQRIQVLCPSNKYAVGPLSFRDAMILHFCPHCGTKLQAGFKFCPSCGEKLPCDGDAESQTAQKHNVNSSKLSDMTVGGRKTDPGSVNTFPKIKT